MTLGVLCDSHFHLQRVNEVGIQIARPECMARVSVQGHFVLYPSSRTRKVNQSTMYESASGTCGAQEDVKPAGACNLYNKNEPAREEIHT